MERRVFFANTGLMAVGLIALSTPASARIACRDGYQLVSGSFISTPYCQDALLSDVARAFGVKASAARIRENPNYKREICRLVGHDIRVQETCNFERPGSRRAF